MLQVSSADDEYEEVNTCEVEDHAQHPKAKMIIGGSNDKPTVLDFQLDTGATCNVISQKDIEGVSHTLTETHKYIRGYSHGIVRL